MLSVNVTTTARRSDRLSHAKSVHTADIRVCVYAYIHTHARTHTHTHTHCRRFYICNIIYNTYIRTHR